MPYTPHVQNRVGEYLFQGITGAAKSYADAVEKRDEEEKQLAAGAKSADYAIQSLPEDVKAQIFDRLHITDQSFKNLGAKEKVALHQGVMKSMVLQQITQEVQDAQAKRKQAADATAQTPGFTAALGDMTSNATGPSLPPLAALGMASEKFPAAGAQLAPHLLAKFAPDPDKVGRPNALSFAEDPVSGMRFGTFGNSVLPSGMNPAKAGNVVKLTGPGGEDLGFGLRNRSGTQPLKSGKVQDEDKYNRLSKQINSLIAAQGKAYTDRARHAYQTQIDELDQQLAELEQGAGAPPSAGASGPDANDPLGIRSRK